MFLLWYIKAMMDLILTFVRHSVELRELKTFEHVVMIANRILENRA